MEEVKFKEEYWGDAIKVLKREERKATMRRYAPLLLILLLIVASGSIYTYMHLDESSLAEEIIEREHITQDFERGGEGVFQNDVTDESSDTEIKQEIDETPRMKEAVQPKGTEIKEDKASTLGEDLSPSESSVANNKIKHDENNIESLEQDDVPTSNNGSQSVNVSEESRAEKLLISESKNNDEITSPQDPKKSIEESILYVGKNNFEHEKNELGLDEIQRIQSINRLSISNKYLSKKIDEKHYDVNRPFPVKVSQLSLILGNSFFTGYGSRKGDLFFNPELGLQYENVMTEKWSTSVSLSYFQVSGVVHNAEFYQTQLDFGYHTTLTKVSTEKLHFAYLPIQLTFNINKRNAFTTGLGLSYLINSESIVTISELDNFGEKELDQYSQWGYLDGYKPLNASVLLGYEFRLTPTLAFEVDYQYGFSKITRSNIYQQLDEDRNSRLRVMFKYQIKAKA